LCVGAAVGDGGGVIVSVGDAVGGVVGDPLGDVDAAGDPDAVGDEDDVGEPEGDAFASGLGLAQPVSTGPKPPHCAAKSPFGSWGEGAVSGGGLKSPGAS